MVKLTESLEDIPNSESLNGVIDIIRSEFYSISHIAVVILRGEDIDRDIY